MSKCWGNGTNRPAPCRVDTNLQFEKKKEKAQYPSSTIKRNIIKQYSLNTIGILPSGLLWPYSTKMQLNTLGGFQKRSASIWLSIFCEVLLNMKASKCWHLHLELESFYKLSFFGKCHVALLISFYFIFLISKGNTVRSHGQVWSFQGQYTETQRPEKCVLNMTLVQKLRLPISKIQACISLLCIFSQIFPHGWSKFIDFIENDSTHFNKWKIQLLIEIWAVFINSLSNKNANQSLCHTDKQKRSGKKKV